MVSTVFQEDASLSHPQFSRWLVRAISLGVLLILGAGTYASVQGDMPALSGAILGGGGRRNGHGGGHLARASGMATAATRP